MFNEPCRELQWIIPIFYSKRNQRIFMNPHLYKDESLILKVRFKIVTFEINVTAFIPENSEMVDFSATNYPILGFIE